MIETKKTFNMFRVLAIIFFVLFNIYNIIVMALTIYDSVQLMQISPEIVNNQAFIKFISDSMLSVFSSFVGTVCAVMLFVNKRKYLLIPFSIAFYYAVSIGFSFPAPAQIIKIIICVVELLLIICVQSKDTFLQKLFTRVWWLTIPLYVVEYLVKCFYNIYSYSFADSSMNALKYFGQYWWTSIGVVINIVGVLFCFLYLKKCVAQQLKQSEIV